MNVPERWLRSFCNPPMKTEKLAHLLTMSGLEVESCAPVAPPLEGVVVGEILSVARHPNADKLTVCEVRAGKRTLRVVCGAPNARPGMKAALATVGTRLGGLEIKAATLRGVESQGMLCSASELGFSNDHSGLLELPATARPGQDLRKALDLDEQVLTFKLTPNRADCLSVLGIAREVAALTGAALNAPKPRPVAARSKARHPFRITHAEGCGRFTGRVIRGVNAAAATPGWMRQRLERAGQRSISALVDVTNYVML
ncbi:MAG: YtpR family tRNA-binding protein, partial [Burkholderiales bacterium]